MHKYTHEEQHNKSRISHYLRVSINSVHKGDEEKQALNALSSFLFDVVMGPLAVGVNSSCYEISLMMDDEAHQDHFPSHAKCCRSLLKEVKVAGVTRIILDCAPENVRTVLMQAQQVGMMSGEEENELGK